jgi:uncharacterized membrane protein YhiD involved in acid resistance
MIQLNIALYRLAIALVFGAVIGIEREWRHKTAGIKTNTLVAIGAATFSMLSNTFGPDNHNPAQIAAAVVTGIGFVGAGVIIHRGISVQGVTTAATLWSNASMGVAVGVGEIYVGTAITIAIVFVQFTMRHAGMWIARVKHEDEASRVELYVECDRNALVRVNETWNDFAKDLKVVTLRRLTTQRDLNLGWRHTFLVPGQMPLDLAALESRLAAIEGVYRIEARFAGYEEAPGAVM